MLSLPIPGATGASVQRAEYQNARVCTLSRLSSEGAYVPTAYVHLDPISSRLRAAGNRMASGVRVRRPRASVIGSHRRGHRRSVLFFGWSAKWNSIEGGTRYRSRCRIARVVRRATGRPIMRFGPDPVPSGFKATPMAVRDGFPFNTFTWRRVLMVRRVSNLQTSARIPRRGNRVRSGVFLRLPAAFQTSADVPRVSVTLERRGRRMSASKHGMGEELVLNLEQYRSAKVGRGVDIALNRSSHNTHFNSEYN